MKENELRLGNLVYRRFEQRSPGGHNYVYSQSKIEWGDLKRIVERYEDYSGIPLTEEWIKKLGFVFNELNVIDDKSDETYYTYKFRESSTNVWAYYIDICPDGAFDFGISWDDINREEIHLCFIKHVHSLQNLIFALTNTELAIK